MNGQVIWITGLSAAGKSTVAKQLVRKLKDVESNTIFLDGDELRDVLSVTSQDGSHHDREQRISLAMRYSRLCKLFASQNFTVVIATISLFREVHEWNRKHLPGYFEVYLKTPMEELRKRDPKDIYKRHAAGEVRNVAGLDLVVDEPENPEILIEFEPGRTPDEIVDQILQKLTRGI